MKKRLFLYLLVGFLSLIIGCSRDNERRRPAAINSNENASSPASKRKSSGQASAVTNTLLGTVIGIMDGDTITLLDDKDASFQVRLKGIDAPERRQAFGDASRVHLARLVAGKTVTIEWQKHDRNGRIVGKILLDGRDICLEQIKAGLAWHYKEFEDEQNEAERNLYTEAELSARSQRLRLWSEPSQIPPWDFRHHPSN